MSMQFRAENRDFVGARVVDPDVEHHLARTAVGRGANATRSSSGWVNSSPSRPTRMAFPPLTRRTSHVASEVAARLWTVTPRLTGYQYSRRFSGMWRSKTSPKSLVSRSRSTSEEIAVRRSWS